MLTAVGGRGGSGARCDRGRGEREGASETMWEGSGEASLASIGPTEVELDRCDGRNRGKRSSVRSGKRRKRGSLGNRATVRKRGSYHGEAEIGPSKEEDSREA